MNGLERNNFFDGKLLTADDLRVEQDYFLEKHRLHNRLFHGCDVVEGLSVSLSGNVVSVSPGVALDCYGNEIVLSETMKSKLPVKKDDVYVTIRYSESKTELVPLPSGEEYNKIMEIAQISWESSDPCRDHVKSKSGWQPCGKLHSIPLAKFRFGNGRWRKLRLSGEAVQKVEVPKPSAKSSISMSRDSHKILPGNVRRVSKLV